MKHKHLLLIFLQILFCNFLFAQTWNGNTSTNWNTASNWTPANVPTATGIVTIPGGLTRYPVLASNVTIQGIDMKEGSQLDFKGSTLNIASSARYNYIIGATLNNSDSKTDIVINFNTGTGGYTSYIRSTTVNDNITFNLSGTNTLNGADAGSSANTYTGNVTINISGALQLNLSHLSASEFNGNLTINRTTAGGTSYLFNGGGNVAGNVSFTNKIGGLLIFGNISIPTTIAGKVDIDVKYADPDGFGLYNVKNNTTGGVINVQNSFVFNVQKDTLLVKSFSITGYRGAQYAYFYNNDITGNLTIADDVSYGGGYSTYLRSNIIKGITNITIKGSNIFREADAGGSANHFKGDVNYTATGTGIISLSDAAPSKYDGNLTINRPGAGHTYAFKSGATIGGNFSFTNNTAGAVIFGWPEILTSVAGKVDIAINDTVPYTFELYGMTNKTTGGIIDVKNSFAFNVQFDTLKVSSLSISGYRGAQYAYFMRNDITGNLSIADDASYGGGYSTYLRSNKITGTTDISVNGPNTFREADNGVGSNHFVGDVNYNATGIGTLSIGDAAASKYEGNLTIKRPGAGFTYAFNSGATIDGNFSFTNKTAGGVILGNTGKSTNVGGKVDIVINDTVPYGFELYRIINQTTGGTINVQNTSSFYIQYDTLKVNSMSITGYQGSSNHANFSFNDITGDLTIADDKTYGGGYSTYIRSNIITGSANFISNSTNGFYEADNGGGGNHFIGDVSFIAKGKATLLISHGDTSIYDGNLTISRPGAGVTQAFNSGGVVNGNFSFTNNTAGGVKLGNTSILTRVAGKMDIAINDTVPAGFELYRMVNQTTGGIINVQNTSSFYIQYDTLKVNSMSITGYQGSSNYANFSFNDITGNLTIASDASYGGGYTTYIRSNNVIGNATFINNASNGFVDADQGNTGNHYTGDVSYNKNGTGSMTVGTGDTTSIGGGLALNSTAIVLSKIQFTDNNDGIVEQTGNFPIIIPTMIMSKGGTAKITLMDTLKVTGSLNLISGIIETGINSNLVLPDNMTYMGGSDSSYVDGPMLKIGNDAFIFPVGQNNKYAPITITAPGAVTDEFRAQYVNEIPHDAGYDSTKKDAVLDHISRAEYWLLDRTAGKSDVSVTLSWEDNRSGGVDDMAALRVARWDGKMWKNLGRGNTTGVNAQGTIQTSAVVSSFSPFTLASITTLNPLPISISRFDALKNKQSVSLKWTTENEINFSHFEVERADGNNYFSPIGKVSAHNGQAMQYYSFEDNQPLKGVNLYRLKLVGSDGKVVYSNVKSILFNANGTITIYPNPAIDFIQIDGVQEGVAIEIHDAGGKLVKRMLSNASNRYSVSNLRKGMYFIKIMDKENTTVSKLIIQ